MTKQVNIRIKESVLKEIDRIIKKMMFVKTRTDFINRAIELMIKEHYKEFVKNKDK